MHYEYKRSLFVSFTAQIGLERVNVFNDARNAARFQCDPDQLNDALGSLTQK